MKHYVVALFLLLSAAPSFADYSAYFSGQAGAFAISADETGFPGHFGNYSVAIHVFPAPSYVTVSGPDASESALVSEMEWLQQQGLLNASCNPSEIASISVSENRYFCNETSAWVACASSPSCWQQPAPPIQKAAPRPAGPVLPSAEAFGAGTAKSMAAGAPNEPQKPSITLEQLLQLVGVFLAVVIASYLILQQRQVQVEPQEERLLENETRAGIMSELEVADKIPTDLSARLGKSKATVVEHLEVLSGAGFVEKLVTPGRKFVFYRLTRKGRQALLRRAA